MKIIQSVLVAAVIAVSSSEAYCDITRFEFDAVVTSVRMQQNLPNRINVGDVFSGQVDMESDLVPLDNTGNSGWYYIAPATQDWIEAEVSIGGGKYSTVGLVGTSGQVVISDFSSTNASFISDSYSVSGIFRNDTFGQFSLITDLEGRQMPSLTDFIIGTSLEQNFTWSRESNNLDPPTGIFQYNADISGPDRLVYIDFSYQRVKVTTPVSLSGSIKTSNGSDICAMVLASGKFMFSCNPPGVLSLSGLPLENDGTVKRQIYADGFFPKIDTLTGSSNDAVVLMRSGTCPNYNATYSPDFVPNSAGKRINIAGKVLTQNSQTPICAMVLANGKHTFSCDGSGNYALNIPLDTNGQFKLQVYADGFAPMTQTYDEFKTTNYVRMARAAECQ